MSKVQTWSFRLRFDMGDTSNLPLDGEEWLIENPESRRVIMKPADGTTTLRQARRAQLCGHDYDDEAAAAREGRYWRDRLTLLFMSTGIGVDFGDRAAFGLAMQPALDRGTAAGAPVMNDVHGLMTFPSSPSPIMMRVGPVTFTVSPSQEHFIETARSLSESRVLLPEASTVAYDLFSASFSTATPDARFMLLMMALETLLNPPPRSDEARALVRSLMSKTEESGLPDGEIKSIVGSLQWLLQDSISRTGRTLAKRLGDRRYQEETPSKFFTECYDLRSKLAHGHLPRPDRGVVDVRAANLQRFLSDLLWSLAAQPDVTD